ncbi:MAG: carbohydrate ABC transporter permease [Chloroflexi bacterium]|nr:carbohydrate ABC transporter permease [Chloroflexota bacterium]
MNGSLTVRAQRTIAYGFLFFILISMATPFVWMISNTFKEQSQIFERQPTLIPEEPHLRNYVSLFVDFDFHKHFLNSAFIAVVHTFSHLFLASLAGFAFAKYNFPLKNFLFLILLGSMMVPLYTIFIPLFVLVIRLGLVNSYAGVIIPGVAGAFGIFFMKQSMEAVPGELLDSARIDGASEFRIYWQIALPLVRPALAVLAVLAFMGSWNDFVWPLVVLRSRELQTLPVVMAGMVSLYRMEYGVVMAASLLSTIPILLLFLVLQKQFLAGLTVGAVKS